MAYIDTATVKKIRNALKEEFPRVKFSVRRRDNALAVSVMKSPLFDNGENQSINHFWLRDIEDTEKREFLTRVDEIIRVTGEHFDHSDSMTDYFHCAFYYDISVGKYDKSHEKTNA